MPRLSDVVRRHGSGYLERHRAAIVPSHARAVRAIVRAIAIASASAVRALKLLRKPRRLRAVCDEAAERSRESGGHGARA